MMQTLQDSASLLVDGDWVESKDQDANGDVRLIQLADIGVGEFLDRSARFLTSSKAKDLRCTYLEEGDVLIARMPDPIGRACVFPGLGQNCVTAVDVAILRPSERADRRFVMHWINSPFFRSHVQAHAKGATRLRISRSKLAKLPIALPDVAQQRDLAARVDASLSLLREVRRLRSTTVVEAAALYPAILRVRLEEISESYESSSLGDVATIIGGQSLPEGADVDAATTDAILLFKVGDMNLEGNEREIVLSRSYGASGCKGRVVPPGSVVLPKRGGAIATNKKRLLTRPAILDPNLMAVHADPAVLLPEYLLAWFENIDLKELSNGGVIPQLNKKDLSPLEIPVPPIGVQESLVEGLNEARRASTELHTSVAAWPEDAEMVRQAVLRRAFARFA